MFLRELLLEIKDDSDLDKNKFEGSLQFSHEQDIATFLESGEFTPQLHNIFI